MATRRAHLRIAVEAAAHAPEPLADAIDRAFDAYCAGALAPDGHGNGAVPRAQTHYYEFSDRRTWGLAMRRLFVAHPKHARPDYSRPAQTAYIAGYLAHLAIDEVFVATLGSLAERGDGEAIVGLAYGVETDWGEDIPELARGATALEQFRPDGLETFVRPEHLMEFVMRSGPMAAAKSPGAVRQILVRAANGNIGLDEAEAEVNRLIAYAHGTFGPNIGRTFARRARAEVVRRLRSYADGRAARYDARSLRRTPRALDQAAR